MLHPLPDLPEWLQDASATMYDGKIVVEGATMRVLDTGEPTALPKGEEPEERIYAYDPSVGSWTKASSEGVHLEQSIVNDGGQLKLVGGGKPDPLYPDFDFMQIPIPVTSYDLSSGAGEELCDLPKVCRDLCRRLRGAACGHRVARTCKTGTQRAHDVGKVSAFAQPLSRGVSAAKATR